MADDLEIKADVIDVLDGVTEPASGSSVVDAHMIDAVEVSAGAIALVLEFPDDYEPKNRMTVEDKIYDALEAIDGVTDVTLESKSKSGEGINPLSVPGASPSGRPSPPAASSREPAKQSGGAGGRQVSGAIPAQKAVEGVDAIIAVASGKGGVGKSTVAVNLALALNRLGYSVGLLDVDIYGPSLPTLLGINARPKVKDRRITPLKAHGLRIMSLGFLMEDDTPVIWRGPIVTGIIRQFLQDVDWRGTQYLIIDLPPGTGDAQLTLAQSCPIDGAVVVTTPSDLALVDAARGLQMFKTLNVEVLGIVENMSHYLWPGAEQAARAVATLRESGADETALKGLEAVLAEHEKLFIFGDGGGRREAERLDLPLLGEIPLDGQVRRGGDEGLPIVVGEPKSPVTAAFLELAHRIVDIKPIEAAAKDPKKKGLFSFLRSS